MATSIVKVQTITDRTWSNLVLACQVCVAEALTDLLHTDLGLTKNPNILHNLFSYFKQKHYNSFRKVIKDHQWDIFCHVCSAHCRALCPKQGVTKLENIDISALAFVYRNLKKLLPNLDAQTILDFKNNYLDYVDRAIGNRNFILHTPYKSIDNVVINERIDKIRSILIGLKYSNMELFNNYTMGSLDYPQSQEDKEVRKISYNRKEKLGDGCQGTIVVKGEFDKREVAVKILLLSNNIEFQREVNLLRESDRHPNVIRYFYTETDEQFRYIALELCQATLQDYITEQLNDKIKLQPTQVLYQILSGLIHLHLKNIVHRDIKPHNILISYPNLHGEVKAMISDFGFCKKLPLDHSTTPTRSGIGTYGWIAPEMFDKNNKMTFKCDIFSYGCVFYYVLSGGAHPFGDNVHRQVNILDGKYTLDKLNKLENEYEARDVLEQMLAMNPIDRPDASTILKHPFFWDKEKELHFFQDVSDRIKNENCDDEIIKTLQKNSKEVVGDNWKNNICEGLQKDLKKYNGAQVRELLRAIRNKKHHYWELPEELRESLGTIPDEFVTYFTKLFPRLLMHTYNSLRKFLEIEEPFQKYYL